MVPLCKSPSTIKEAEAEAASLACWSGCMLLLSNAFSNRTWASLSTTPLPIALDWNGGQGAQLLKGQAKVYAARTTFGTY